MRLQPAFTSSECDQQFQHLTRHDRRIQIYIDGMWFACYDSIKREYMSLLNKRTVRKYVCTACNVNAVKSFGARCRPCFDKPFIEADARQAEHNARLKAEHDREWAKTWESAKNNNSRPQTSSRVSNEAAMVIAFVAGVYLAYEGHGISNFFLIGSVVMAALHYGSNWWNGRHVRRLEKRKEELKRKLW